MSEEAHISDARFHYTNTANCNQSINTEAQKIALLYWCPSKEWMMSARRCSFELWFFFFHPSLELCINYALLNCARSIQIPPHAKVKFHRTRKCLIFASAFRAKNPDRIIASTKLNYRRTARNTRTNEWTNEKISFNNFGVHEFHEICKWSKLCE